MARLTKTDELDFEISFYEDILKGKPDFVDVLIPLGDAYTMRGLYEKGLEVDRRLAKLMPADPIIHYNLACDCALLKMSDDALTTLDKAISLGYRDFKYMESDPDLGHIKKDPRFKELIARHRSRRAGKRARGGRT